MQRGDEELVFAMTTLISATCSVGKLCTGAAPWTTARQSIIIVQTKNFCMSIKTLVQNPDVFSCWSAPSDSVSASPKAVLQLHIAPFLRCALRCAKQDNTTAQPVLQPTKGMT